MHTDTEAYQFSEGGLSRFLQHQEEAVETVTQRFYDTFPRQYARYGPRGRQYIKEDLGYHLEFMRPVLEFGLIQSFIDYLLWLKNVLVTRGNPATHLPLSIEWLGDFYTERLPAQDTAALRKLIAVSTEALESQDERQDAYKDDMPEAWLEAESFEKALLAGDKRTASSILDKIVKEKGYVEAALHVVQPALYQIGDKWQHNLVSVAQEHLATSIVHGVLFQASLHAEPALPNGKTAVFACVAGNKHAVGLRMVADSFELAGWETHFLGADVPARDLAAWVKMNKPDLVGMSLSMPEHITATRNTIQEIKKTAGENAPAIILGGIAINQHPPLASQLGASQTSRNAQAAVEAVQSMLND